MTLLLDDGQTGFLQKCPDAGRVMNGMPRHTAASQSQMTLRKLLVVL